MTHKTDSNILTSSAVALRYRPQELPRVVAKGKGYIAQQIIQTAESSGVPLHHDPELTQALSALEIQQTIPKALFSAIAQVLVFAFEVKQKRSQERSTVSSPEPSP